MRRESAVFFLAETQRRREDYAFLAKTQRRRERYIYSRKDAEAQRALYFFPQRHRSADSDIFILAETQRRRERYIYSRRDAEAQRALYFFLAETRRRKVFPAKSHRYPGFMGDLLSMPRVFSLFSTPLRDILLFLLVTHLSFVDKK